MYFKLNKESNTGITITNTAKFAYSEPMTYNNKTNFESSIIMNLNLINHKSKFFTSTLTKNTNILNYTTNI